MTETQSIETLLTRATGVQWAKDNHATWTTLDPVLALQDSDPKKIKFLEAISALDALGAISWLKTSQGPKDMLERKDGDYIGVTYCNIVKLLDYIKTLPSNVICGGGIGADRGVAADPGHRAL